MKCLQLTDCVFQQLSESCLETGRQLLHCEFTYLPCLLSARHSFTYLI